MFEKCDKGFSLRNGKCERTPVPEILGSCVIDGKHFCTLGDKPLRPPIARPGGKSQLADKIIDKMKPHKVYVEPFVGGGAVFLKKPLAEKNVINDKDTDVATVFKSFKEGEGFNKCDMTPSKERFDRIKNKPNKNACGVAYLNKLSFGSHMKTIGKKFINESQYERDDVGIEYQKKHKVDYQKKLKNTKIENKDFKEVMKQTDSKDTLHFLDPPYFESDKMYKEKGVTPKEVCDIAKQMKGQVIITYNDHPEVRNKCSGLKMEKISSRYTFGADSNNKQSKELLITNY